MSTTTTATEAHPTTSARFQSIALADVGDVITLGWGTLDVIQWRIVEMDRVTPLGQFPAGYRVKVEPFCRVGHHSFNPFPTEPQVLHLTSGVGYDLARGL